MRDIVCEEGGGRSNVGVSSCLACVEGDGEGNDKNPPRHAN